MKWTFETSLMVFLALVALSQFIAIKSKHRISLQFSLGVFSIVGYTIGFFPSEMIEMSKMKDVGFIAFNVLIIHSGTMLDLNGLKHSKNIIGLSLCSSAIMIIVVGIGLQPVLGAPFAWISAAPIIGGGATSAIASVSVMKTYPYLSVLPWILFMIQGFISVPILSKALKNETEQIIKERNLVDGIKSEKHIDDKYKMNSVIGSKINDKYKHTAYYLATLMTVSVINQLIVSFIPEEIPIHPALTALFLGCILGHFSILDRSPLSKSDSFGFLMLGLMSLMCHTLAFITLDSILKMLVPAMLAFVVGGLSLWFAGTLLGPYFGMTRTRGRVIAVSAMAGIPLGAIIVDEMIIKFAKNESDGNLLKHEIKPAVITTGLWVTNAFSIFIASIVMVFLS